MQYHQLDPDSIRREAEALEGICHDMSEYVYRCHHTFDGNSDMQTSDVLDVFTSLPQLAQSNSNFTSPPATPIDKDTPMAKTNEKNTTKMHEPESQWAMYRSVRPAPSAGHIWRDLSRDPKSLEEAKAVMEGSGERG